MEEGAVDQQVCWMGSYFGWFEGLYICRIHQAQRDSVEVVDVDGSYTYRKHKQLVETGLGSPLPLPSGVCITGQCG